MNDDASNEELPSNEQMAAKNEKPHSHLWDLALWLSLGLPGISVVLVLLSPLLPEHIYYSWFLSETGFIEVATFVFLLVGIFYLGRILVTSSHLPKDVRFWLIMLLLASIYFAGEELDWGQVWFPIPTPEALSEVNREGQLSLHKIDGHPIPRFLFNVGPRLAATLFLLAGGVISFFRLQISSRLPLRWRQTAHWLLPTHAITPVCLLAVFSTVPAKVLKLAYESSHAMPDYFYLALRKPAGEFKEYCIALAIMLYVLSLNKRHRNEDTETTRFDESHLDA